MTPKAALKAVAEADAAFCELPVSPFALPVDSLAPVVAGALSALADTDWWIPGLRERAGAALRQVPLEQMTNPARGAPPYSVGPPGVSAALRALYATGLALANPDGTTLVHLGIGSVSDGAFAEALNTAALHNAPVVFLVAVHPLSGDAPLAQQSAASPTDLAKAYGISSTSVDGSDAAAVQRAVKSAKKHSGPFVIEAHLSNPNETKSA